MIPVSPLACQDTGENAGSWQNILQQAISDPEELCQRLSLPFSAGDDIRSACHQFPLRVPETYLRRMEPGNPQDPLLLQVVPRAAELEHWPGFTGDPLAECKHNPVPGLIHKYTSRVLLIATSLCAVHCRYCFRREFPYENNRNSRQEWLQALEYIRQHKEVNEVILSGGDPLSLPDRQLAWLHNQIANIPHILRLRIHTRLPVVIPQRITNECLDWLTSSRLSVIVVLHCNHANEIDDSVTAAIHALRLAGITVLNQSVLLKGINDSATALADLSEKLFASGCLPYYLHVLDRVTGSHAFDINDQHAIALHQALQARLPGFLVPKLVRENSGMPSKTWLS